MDSRAPSMLKATLIGGAVFGVAGGIPIVNWLNCACCALVVAGGFLAAFLYSKECGAQSVPFRAGNGALVGLVAGVFYAIANTIVAGLVNLVRKPDPEQMMDMMEQWGVPPESIEMAERFMQSSGGILGLLIGFVVTLLLAAIFSTIGGLIGGAVFKVEPAPPAPSAPTVGAPPPPPVDAPPPPPAP